MSPFSVIWPSGHSDPGLETKGGGLVKEQVSNSEWKVVKRKL